MTAGTGRQIRTQIQGVDLTFETAPDLFSPDCVDDSTLAMLSQVRIEQDDKVLDLGCGYGAVGVFAAKFAWPASVFMIDVDPRATDVAARNAVLNDVADASVQQSDGFRQFQQSGFTKILCNPPFHADFSIPKHFIEKGFNRLAVGGAMWMVTRREAWYRNKLASIFGGVRMHQVGEFRVFEAVKRSADYGGSRAPRA